MKKRFLKALLFAMAVFLLYSCIAKAQASPEDALAKAFAKANLRLLNQKVSPRDFSLPPAGADTPGNTQSLSALKGRVVFLNFWATWCGPCRAEMPSMETLYKRCKDKGLEILAVNAGESRQDVLAFMANNGLSFPALIDEDGKVNRAYGIQAIPTTFLIDREGKIILRLVGSIDWDTPEIHAAMEMLLAEE